MEFHQLRYFCAVAKAANFTRAAEQLGISQPSLSQQIGRLEKKVGVPLFVRLGRTVRLTPYGEALLPRALETLKEISEMESSLSNLQEGTRGVLRVGVIPTIMPYMIAPKIHEFACLYPDLEIQLSERVTARLVEDVQAGQLDLAILGLPIANPDLVCSELFREPLYLAVGPTHPLAKNEAVNLKDLRSERMLLLREGHCFRDNVMMACTRANAQVQSVFETDQMGSIFPLVASGFGVTLVPAMATASATGCTIIPVTPGSVRRVGYIRSRRHFVGKPMRAFVKWLKANRQEKCS
jgi:LysR family hydrogen peroxide-inducible transcriptional activator